MSASSTSYSSYLRLNSLTRRRIDQSYRGMATVGIALLMLNYYSWGGTLTWISAAISVSTITTASCYGHALISLWRCFYSSVIASFIGCLISYTYSISPTLQLILLFISLTAINRVHIWERLAKVYGGFCCIIATVYPNVTTPPSYGLQNIGIIAAISIVVYTLPCISLYYPFPKFATYQAITLVNKISRRVNSINENIIMSFISIHRMEIRAVNADYSFIEVEEYLDALLPLCTYSIWETIVLPPTTFPESIRLYHSLFSRLVLDFRGIHRILQDIPMNTTHDVISKALSGGLVELLGHMTTLINLIQQHIRHHTTRLDPSTPPLLSSLYMRYEQCMRYSWWNRQWGGPEAPVGLTSQRSKDLIFKSDKYTSDKHDLEHNASFSYDNQTINRKATDPGTRTDLLGQFDFVAEQLRGTKERILIAYRTFMLRYIWNDVRSLLMVDAVYGKGHNSEGKGQEEESKAYYRLLQAIQMENIG